MVTVVGLGLLMTQVSQQLLGDRLGERDWLMQLWRLRSSMMPAKAGTVILVQTQRCENQRRKWLSSDLSLKAQGPGQLMSQGRSRWTSQLSREWMSPWDTFCSPLRPSAEWVVPIWISKVIFFSQSTDSNANFFWEHPHEQPRHTVLWAI